MNITFECRVKKENYFKKRLGFIMRGFANEITISEIIELCVVSDNVLSNENGKVEYSIINDAIEYKILIKQSLVTEENVINNRSDLYITIYHELHHVKDAIAISKNVNLRNILRNITLFNNQNQMNFSLGCILWSEYYAYTQQFKKYGGHLKEEDIFADFRNISSALIAYKDVIHTDRHRATSLLNRTIYEGLYDICIILAYKTTTPMYDYEKLIGNVGNVLKVNLIEYIDVIHNVLTEYLQTYPQNFTTEFATMIGKGFVLFYKLMHINISFDQGLILEYDETQPFITWYNKLTNNPL